MKTPRTSRRLISALAAVAAGIVGALVVASPASAHTAGIQPLTYCDGEQAKVKFTITSAIHADSDHVKIVEVEGTFTAAELGIDTSAYYPVQQTNSEVTVLETNAVNLGAGQPFSISVTLEWYNEFNGTYYEKPGLFPHAEGSGAGTDCHVPEKPKVSFVDTCDTITATFQSEVATTFTLELGDGSTKSSPGALTEWTIEVPATAAPLTAFAGQDPIENGSHEYSKPRFCGAPSGAIESTCEGLTFSLTNPEDGKDEEVSLTLTPNTGDPVTLTATRGQTATHTFPGTDELTVSYTPLGGGDTETVAWQPDPEKCAPPTTTTPPLPDTGTGGLTEIIAAGSALVLAGAGLLTLLFLRRRRATAQG